MIGRLVGQASSGREAVDLARITQPDVVLLDVSMPDLDGVGAAQAIRKEAPNSAILALSAHEDEAYVMAMLEAGAMGYLSKSARGREVIDAVRATADGEAVFSPSIAARVMRRALSRRDTSSGPSLTERELDVLRAAARGLGNKQIAAELQLSPRTVQAHLANIFGKLGVASRTEAVTRGIREGWLSLGDLGPGWGS
jgi:DNA-binding NarL/FixJ family response regulator